MRAKELGLPSRAIKAKKIRKISEANKFATKCGIFAAVRQLDAKACGYLAIEAERRNMSTEAFVIAVLRNVANDRLCNAIMDDAEVIETICTQVVA